MSLNYLTLFSMLFVFREGLFFEIRYGANKLMHVEEEENGTLTITCTLTKEKITDLKLLDIAENENFSYRMEMSSCADFKCVFDPAIKTFILNSTSIQATVREEEILNASCHTHLKCYFNQRYTLLDDIFFVVANQSQPKPVQDFDCKFFNFEQVICHWSGPQNCVYTSYNLTYSPRNHRIHREESMKNPWMYDRVCNESTRNLAQHFDYNSGIRNYACLWKLYYHDKVNNYDFAPYYDFKLHMFNECGYRSQNMSFAHHEHVISDAPVVEIYETTPDSIHLLLGSRNTDKTSCTKYMGFEYRVFYKSQYENQWKTENISSCVRQGIFFFKPDLKISHLKYANDNYTIKVTMVNTVYKGKGGGESKYTVITAKTKPAIPARPPYTMIGSFEIIQEPSNYNIRIYWNNIKKTEENGDKFSYRIKIDEEDTIFIVPSNNFSKIFHDVKDQNYTFKIWSVNEVGPSSNYSVVFVPAKKHRPKPITRITQIYLEDTYLVAWEPRLGQMVESYTLFWCEVRDHLVDRICMKNWQWTTLSPSISNLTTPVNNSHLKYQFGISVNLRSLTSSGIFRTQIGCMLFKTTFKNNIVMHVEEKNTTSIAVSWKPNCVGLNYALSYCPVVLSHEKPICTKQPDTLFAIKLKIATSLFAEDIVALVRTAAGSSKLSLLIALGVIAIFVLMGVGILLRKMKKRMKIEKIDPVLSPRLNQLIENSLDASQFKIKNQKHLDLKAIEAVNSQEPNKKIKKTCYAKITNSADAKANKKNDQALSYILMPLGNKGALENISENNQISNYAQTNILQDKANPKKSHGYVCVEYIPEIKNTHINDLLKTPSGTDLTDFKLNVQTDKKNMLKRVRFSYHKLLPGYLGTIDKSNLKIINKECDSSKEINFNHQDNFSSGSIKCNSKAYVTCKDLTPKNNSNTEMPNVINKKPFKCKEVYDKPDKEYISIENATVKPGSINLSNANINLETENKYKSKNNSASEIKSYNRGYVACEEIIPKNNSITEISIDFKNHINTHNKPLKCKKMAGKPGREYISLDDPTLKLSSRNFTNTMNNLETERKYRSKNNSANKVKCYNKGYVTCKEIIPKSNSVTERLDNFGQTSDLIVLASKPNKRYISLEDISSSNFVDTTHNLEKENKQKQKDDSAIKYKFHDKRYVSLTKVSDNFENTIISKNEAVASKANKEYISLEDILIMPSTSNFTTHNLEKENKCNDKRYVTFEDILPKS